MSLKVAQKYFSSDIMIFSKLNYKVSLSSWVIWGERSESGWITLVIVPLNLLSLIFCERVVIVRCDSLNDFSAPKCVRLKGLFSNKVSLKRILDCESWIKELWSVYNCLWEWLFSNLCPEKSNLLILSLYFLFMYSGCFVQLFLIYVKLVKIMNSPLRLFKLALILG